MVLLNCVCSVCSGTYDDGILVARICIASQLKWYNIIYILDIAIGIDLHGELEAQVRYKV